MNDSNSVELPEPEPTGTYTVPSLGIEDGTFIFTYLGTFLSYITPHDLPVELLRDVFHSKVTVPELIFEALKIESGFICLMSLFFIVSILPLAILFAWCCTNKFTNDENGEVSSPQPPPETVDSIMTMDESLEDELQCQRRTSCLFLQLIILFLIAGTIVMFITNEQISSAIDKTPNVVKASLQDAEMFIKDTYKQITLNLNEGLITAHERVKIDLDDIDKLLGEPIQQDLSTVTGIEVAFEEILNICSLNMELVSRINLLHKSLNKALQVSGDASSRMEELQIQLSVLQRQCITQDRPLCDTLRLKSFEESDLMEGFLRLQKEQTLLKMLTLGEVEIDSTWKNLTYELNVARSKFRNFPFAIQEETAKQRYEILKQLVAMKDEAELSNRQLELVAKRLLDGIDHTWGTIVPIFDDIKNTSNFLWILGLTAATITLVVTLILLSAMSLGCCHAEHKAGITLIIGGGFISIASITLSFSVVVFMLLGGHGEVFLCRPLYDNPNYFILRRLLDKPGLIYANEPIVGIVDELLRPTGVNNAIPNNTTLPTVITECEKSKSSYSVFQLEHLINITKITNYEDYPELKNSINGIRASGDSLSTLTQPLERILAIILNESYVNLTKYRLELSQPTPERDLATFTDQMQRVSLQIRDVATSSRMTTLGSRARRLQATVLQPLEQLRGDILYHLTALELQKNPWEKQVNRSLIHLRSAQHFLDQEGSKVCTKKSEQYRTRLKQHFNRNKENLLNIFNNNVANCLPIFEIFSINRLLLCKHIMNPLNGNWFASFFCLLIYPVATGLCLSLAKTYKKLKKAKNLRHTNSHQYGAPSDTLIISEQSNWAPTSSDSINIDRSNW